MPWMFSTSVNGVEDEWSTKVERSRARVDSTNMSTVQGRKRRKRRNGAQDEVLDGR